MRNYEILNEFRFRREISLIYTIRELGISLKEALHLQKDEPIKLTDPKALQYFRRYLKIRNKILPHSEYLFPTDEGLIYLPVKFCQNVKKLLNKAGLEKAAHHPAKMQSDHFKAILALEFEYFRPVYQQIIATGLSGSLALRSSETAGLLREDIVLEEKPYLILRETKSQEPQTLRIPPQLVNPLSRYIQHIGTGEPLFIGQDHRQWTRRDVNRALKKWANYCSLKTDITPRRMRNTLAHKLVSMKVPINVVSRVLRHADPATTLRFYASHPEGDEVENALGELVQDYLGLENSNHNPNTPIVEDDDNE